MYLFQYPSNNNYTCTAYVTGDHALSMEYSGVWGHTTTGDYVLHSTEPSMHGDR